MFRHGRLWRGKGNLAGRIVPCLRIPRQALLVMAPHMGIQCGVTANRRFYLETQSCSSSEVISKSWGDLETRRAGGVLVQGDTVYIVNIQLWASCKSWRFYSVGPPEIRICGKSGVK